MRLYRRRNHDIPALNTASLPDLIFSILFFFMLVVHMRKATVHVYIGRPMDETGKVTSQTPVVQMNDKVTNIPEIRNYLIHLVASLPPEERKQLSVSIKADRHVDMGLIIDLKQALREANILNVNFSATMSHKKG